MDPLKRTHIVTRSTTRSQTKLSENEEKENVNSLKRTVQPVKKAAITQTTTTTVTTTTTRNLELPQQRRRIFSDIAILPPQKKVKIVVTRPQIANSIINRRPLVDIDNIAGNVIGSTKTNIQKNKRVKSVSFKNVHSPSHVQTKVEETIDSKKITNSQYGSETNIYHSKSARLTDYEDIHPKINSGLPKSTSDSNIASLANYSEATTPEIDKPFNVDRKKITIRKSLTPHPRQAIKRSTDSDSDSDEIFIDSSKHFISFKPPEDLKLISEKQNTQNLRIISPIKPNMFTPKSEVIFQGIPEQIRKPSKKMSLVHKTQLSPGKRPENFGAYCLDIYNTEYLEDILYHQLTNDWKYVLKRNILKLYNPCICNRTAVINWLIQAHDYLNLSQSVLFTTVRLFDNVLGSTSVPGNMCQLVGMVIMWIINKFDDNIYPLRASKLLTICNKAYTIQQFSKMEKKLLIFFNFDLKISDLTVYITFYIKKLNIENDLLLHCANYILECYTLNVEFSTLIASVLAAAAVCLALNILYPLSNFWQKLENIVGYYEMEALEDVTHKMLQQLHKVQDPAYQFRQPYEKYSSSDKVQVSIVLLRKLIAT